MKAPKAPVPLADAVDPNTRRRRAVIRISDGRVIEGKVGGGGGGDSIDGWNWEN